MVKPAPVFKKKGLEAFALVSILICVAGFAAIGYVIYITNKTYTIDQELTLTRASLFAAQALSLEYASAQLWRPKLYLKTHFVSMPEEGYTYAKEDLAKNIAERAMDCWWAFGNGRIGSNVFETSWAKISSDRCFVCMVFYVEPQPSSTGKKQASGSASSQALAVQSSLPAASVASSDSENVLSTDELLAFIYNVPYKAKDAKKKKCTDEEKANNDPDCIHAGMPECEVKGGVCRKQNSCLPNELTYAEWNCKKTDSCCLRREQLMTYADYLQEGGGILYFSSSLFSPAQAPAQANTQQQPSSSRSSQHFFEPGKTYAIIFKDKTEKDTISAALYLLSYSIPGPTGGLKGFLTRWILGLDEKEGWERVSDLIYLPLGPLVGFGKASYDLLAMDYLPQGIVIGPYPANDYANCVLLDERQEKQ
ncbi:MAG: hypothetical protein QW594_02520 [Candidatus Woesearchaeota archaeon]